MGYLGLPLREALLLQALVTGEEVVVAEVDEDVGVVRGDEGFDVRSGLERSTSERVSETFWRTGVEIGEEGARRGPCGRRGWRWARRRRCR